jgi:hypothetical protein
MQLQQLDSIGERLLQAGIAPRHVRRYLNELRDHYDDAVQDELTKGSSRAAAEEAAANRLGEPERLIQSALARPELRSVMSRYPRFALGAGPVLLWAATCALLSSLLLWPWDAIEWSLGIDPMSGMTIAYGTFVFLMRIFPLIIALGVLVLAFRQRLPMLWPVVGATIVAVFAGTIDITFLPASTYAESSLGVSSSLIPLFVNSDVTGPVQAMQLAQGALRAVIVLTVAIILFAPFRIWSRARAWGYWQDRTRSGRPRLPRPN